MAYLIKKMDDLLQKAHDSQTCISCGGDASEFNQEIDRKEYSISGLCQKCQDEIFK